MENILDDRPQYDSLQITANSRQYLAETAKWAKFMAIVGFVMMGLMILFGLFFGSIMGSLMSEMGDEVPGMGSMGGAMGIFYVALSAIYFFPCYYLLKFANQTKAALTSNDSHTLSEAFENHKSVYKFMGIFTLVILGFYLLIFLVALIAGLAF